MADRSTHRLRINPHWCKGCGICAAFCPKQVLEIADQKCRIAAPEQCIYCALCELRCPDYAIWLEEVAENG